jgi:hypothetical protein
MTLDAGLYGLLHKTRTNARRANLHPTRLAVDLGAHLLEVWSEHPLGNRRHMLTDATRFLRLTATKNRTALDSPFATNITNSRHN